MNEIIKAQLMLAANHLENLRLELMTTNHQQKAKTVKAMIASLENMERELKNGN